MIFKKVFVVFAIITFTIKSFVQFVYAEENRISEASGASMNYVSTGDEKTTLRVWILENILSPIAGARIKVWDKDQKMIYQFNLLVDYPEDRKVQVPVYKLIQNEDFNTFKVEKTSRIWDAMINRRPMGTDISNMNTINVVDTFVAQGLPSYMANGKFLLKGLDGEYISTDSIDEITLFTLDDITLKSDEDRYKYNDLMFHKVQPPGEEVLNSNTMPEVRDFKDFFGTEASVPAYRKSWLGGRLDESDPIPSKVAMITYEPLIKFYSKCEIVKLSSGNGPQYDWGEGNVYLFNPGSEIQLLTQKELETRVEQDWHREYFGDGESNLINVRTKTEYFTYAFGKNQKLDTQIESEFVKEKIEFLIKGSTEIPLCGAYCHYATDVSTPSQIFVKFHPNGGQLSTEAGDSEINKINEEFTINTNSGEKVSIPRTFPDNFSKYV